MDSIEQFARTGVLPAFCLARCCECFHISKIDLHHIEHDTDATVDGEYIKDMLIPVSYHDATRLHRLWGFVNWVPDEGEKYFTCKHWDPETRLCTDYENRPGMCRRYGTTKACRHGCGCGNV